jgi:predicted acetyltransferase
MDWKATLEAGLLPIDHPLLHQLSYPRRMRMRISDGLWVRLVDVGAALSARAYAATAPSSSRSKTRSCPRTRAAGGSPGGKAERTETEADLALDVGELGSAYLGGFTFGELVRAGVVRELRDGGAARAERIFLTVGAKPWCTGDLLRTPATLPR